MKYLIVTGDDFGRSHEVNEAIERAHEAGFLTQASLMVNEPYAEEAVRIAARHPALCVGLHLTLCDGRASSVSALTNEAGEFRASPAHAGLSYAFRPSLAGPLLREIRAQFERFRSLGFAPTYWDGHAHLHLHPTIFRGTLPVAVQHCFHAMRLVRETLGGATSKTPYDALQRRLGSRRSQWALLPRIFELLSRAAVSELQRHAITFGDHTFGLRDTGRITAEVAARILQNLPDGVSELYFHPGAEPGEIDCAALLSLLAEREITLRTSLPPPAVG